MHWHSKVCALEHTETKPSNREKFCNLFKNQDKSMPVSVGHWMQTTRNMFQSVHAMALWIKSTSVISENLSSTQFMQMEEPCCLKTGLTFNCPFLLFLNTEKICQGDKEGFKSHYIRKNLWIMRNHEFNLFLPKHSFLEVLSSNLHWRCWLI